MDNSWLIFEYDVSKVERCLGCHKLGHKKCVRGTHDCTLDMNAQR